MKNAVLTIADKSVFLIDDDPFIQDVMTEQLNFLGVKNVLHASNGRQALQMLSELPSAPDLVVFDVYMPVMDGMEFLTALAAQGYTGGVLLASGANALMREISATIAVESGLNLRGSYAKPLTNQQIEDALLAPSSAPSSAPFSAPSKG
jgi:CheY-like chemotaxis protein